MQWIKKSNFGFKTLSSLCSFLVLTFPSTTFGCSVCFVGREESLFAYYSTTILLTTLPFVLAGLFAIWFFRQRKKHNEMNG